MTKRDDDQKGARLREAPVDRFAGNSHAFDLSEALAQLRAEGHLAKGGHRQITVLHRAPVAHVLFAFEPGGKLEKHSARGEVTIHVLEGRILVEADGRDHDLRPGHLLILGPNVLHDVRASEASAMLLTVHMPEEKTESPPVLDLL
jgi:quercetin dioxygenase-like cupin family protein